ncbi:MULTISPECIES: hypothetical protein [unclassified Sphingobium]|uniref:hypothetical protein n=1 Tax=unclassified Sphingobium TaxID=2611147 RepID=UPI0011A9C6E5|nr:MULTISPECIES: hypothetical protein [unclassified Sphingobium]MBG6118009.1 hypothetical protein [Sphingobium sp. JAI105]
MALPLLLTVEGGAYAAHASIAVKRAITHCSGGVQDVDLPGGEIELANRDFTKPSPKQQLRLRSFLGARSYRPLTPELNKMLGVTSNSGRKWSAVEVTAKYGKEANEAERTFYSPHALGASFFPATKKLAVGVALPFVPDSHFFSFIVLIDMPKDTKRVTVDCTTFR